MKYLALAAVALLPACALQSNPPLFGDAQASPALGSAPLTLTDGQTTLALAPTGQGYQDMGGSTANYRFVPLPGGGYVMQIVTGDRAGYALATWDGQVLETRPLDCARLKTDLRTNGLVQLVDAGCRLRPGVDPLTAFATMADTAPPPALRLTRP